MTLTLSPIFPDFAANVSGVDLTRPLSPADARAIEAGINTFAVLVFRGQNLSDDQQRDFSLNFGSLEPTGESQGERQLGAFIEDISNLDENNKPLAREDGRRLFNVANQLWHSDNSFQPTPATYSILSGRIVVEGAGRTEFADMRAAYDTLDARTKAEIEDLICEHSWIYSRQALGVLDVSAAEWEAFAPARHRLVRTHPATGHKSLYLSSHIGAVVGWSMPEARAFIRDLTERALRASPIYSHSWRQHDLLMWDNRATMHRVTRYDPSAVRDMRRTTIAAGKTPNTQFAEK